MIMDDIYFVHCDVCRNTGEIQPSRAAAEELGTIHDGLIHRGWPTARALVSA